MGRDLGWRSASAGEEYTGKGARDPAERLSRRGAARYLAAMATPERDDAEPKPIPKHVKALETALRTLHAVGSSLGTLPASAVDLAPVARGVERAIVCALEAYDAQRDPLAATRDAMSAIDEARRLVTEASTIVQGITELSTWLERARGWLAVAESTFLRTPTFGPLPRDLVASKDAPELFRIGRPCVAPRFETAPVLPPPTAPTTGLDLAGLPMADKMAKVREHAALARDAARERRDARAAARRARDAAEPEAPRPGFVAGRHVALTPDGLVKRRARELFEEVMIGGVHRVPLVGDAWRTMDVVDKRMLRALDAFAALGPRAVASLEAQVLEAPAKDPSRGFAVGFIAGAFEGRDMLAVVERCLRHLGPADPEVGRMLARALVLVPHPDLPVVLRTWLQDDDPLVRALAIDVLGYRRLATEDELSAALRSDSRDVVAAAMPWAALSRSPELRAALDGHRGSDHETLAAALAWAPALSGARDATERLSAMLGTERESHALLPLALTADADDAAKLVELVRAEPSAPRIEALGWAGPKEAIGALVAVLADSKAKGELKQAAAFALQRITGAEIYDDVDLPPEKLDAETPEDPPGLPAPPPLRKTLSPRDKPSDGSPDRMKLPPTRLAPWEAFLQREQHRFQGPARFRRGKPYTPATTLIELDTYRIPPNERRLAFRELVIKTGQVVPFDPEDFVHVQEAALDAWAPIASRASSQPGAWGRAERR
jgi:hypothetical protein